jgi:RNA ligase (TIGR02306 family)
MSTFAVTIERIEVFPHPNADRLELARVGLYNIVVAKDIWKTGDKVLYIPEYAVLPETLIEFLGLEGKLAGPKGDRVKPVRLRGELSQGLVAPLSLLPEGTVERIGEDGDFAEVLGITKWVPEIPTSMSGEVEGNYSLISWVDIENIKKFPDMFTEGEPVIVDEKIHGTATLISVINPLDENPEVLVSSKGLGEKKLVLREDDKVLYWKTVKNYPIIDLARVVAGEVPGTVKVGIFGETFGSKVQDLHYGFTGGDLGYTVFDVYVEFVSEEDGSAGRWLSPEEVKEFAAKVNMPLVPRLYEGPFSLEKITELASGKEQVSGKELHIREGVVVRPVNRGVGYDTGKSKIGKFVSEAYLTRKGGTEYQ